MRTAVLDASSASPNFGLPAELAELADGYEFVGELGRGGSAIVYRASDRSLGRDVAIKVVHPRATSPGDDAVARLAREARTVAQLQHPGIVTVYAVHRLHGGGIALVMQFVPGATLKQAIARGGPLTAQRAEQILRDVADALAYAHAHHIIHRDVKPENIFLDAESGRALLADFGIARSGETDSTTMTGTAIGTPFYMSPEQVDGQVMDGRSDVYSLGLVAWEMLTGLRPWDGESLYHVIYKQKHDVLPPIEAIRPDVPRRLQYIIERMLQKQPAARWAGADGLLAQLDRTILPGDYARWQGALSARVARHRAASASRHSVPNGAERATVATAATVQFSTLDAMRAAVPATPALATTSVIATRVEQPPMTTPPERSPGAVADAEEERFPEPPSASPRPSRPDAAGGATVGQFDARSTYDVVTPTWSIPGVQAPAARAWWSRTLRAGSVIGAVVLAAGLGASARTFIPSEAVMDGAAPLTHTARLIPPPMMPSRWASRTRRATTTVAAPPDIDSTTHDLITVGTRHACDITRVGHAQCWGENDAAQLGGGTLDERSDAPRTVAGVMTYVALSAGAAHTCGVTAAGDVYCWGTNELGQLGDGTTIRRTAPVRIGGVGTYRTVRSGAAHTCALDVDGSVRCWGDNSLGQIGDGSRGARFVPTAVHLPSGAASAIATGAQHSCALLRDQRVLCWGSNMDGQLGVTGVAASDQPREVSGVRATAITAGQAHTCVLLTRGAVNCWGHDDAGQLGSGTTVAGVPGKVMALPGRERVGSLAAGGSNSCALTRGGSVWCWGAVINSHHGAPVHLGHGPYVALAVGANVSCAVSSGRTAECWTGTAVSAPVKAPTRAAITPRRPLPRRSVPRRSVPRRHWRRPAHHA